MHIESKINNHKSTPDILHRAGETEPLDSPEMTSFLAAVEMAVKNKSAASSHDTSRQGNELENRVVSSLINLTHVDDLTTLTRIRALQSVDTIEAAYEDTSLDIHLLPILANPEIYEDEEGRAAIDSLLDRKVRDTSIPYGKKISAVIENVGHVYGKPMDWATRDDLPPYIANLMDNELYWDYCLEIPYTRFDSNDDAQSVKNKNYEKQKESFRAIDLFLKDVVKLPEQMRTDIALSFAERFQPRRLKEDLTEDTPSVDYTDIEATHRAIVGSYGAVIEIAKRVKPLGVGAAINLHDKLGIVNFDRYHLDALDLSNRVLNQDPVAIEMLQNGETTLSITEAFRDSTNAFSEINIAHDRKRMIVSEIRQASGFYRPFIHLKQRGIRPSTVVINVHGRPGKMGFRTASGDELAVQALFQPDEEDGQPLKLSEANIARLTHEFMQPQKESGERKIILKSCSQAKGSLRKPSTAATIAWKTRFKDNVVVIAVETPSVTRYDNETNTYNYYSVRKAESLPAIEFRKRRLGRIAQRTATPMIRI